MKWGERLWGYVGHRYFDKYAHKGAIKHDYVNLVTQ